MVTEREEHLLQHHMALALLQLALDQIQSTVWATDTDLLIHIIANGGLPTTYHGVHWDVGKTVYEIFKTEDPEDPAIAAHLGAVAGKASEVRLSGGFANMFLRVVPLYDESEQEVLGCISILNNVGTERSLGG
jgi:hypothetical protein